MDDKKPGWLKTDFDRWRSEDDSEEEMQEEITVRIIELLPSPKCIFACPLSCPLFENYGTVHGLSTNIIATYPCSKKCCEIGYL